MIPSRSLKRADNSLVCPESCRLLAGESPVAVMVRQPRSRQPVLLPKEPPPPQGGFLLSGKILIVEPNFENFRNLIIIKVTIEEALSPVKTDWAFFILWTTRFK